MLRLLKIRAIVNIAIAFLYLGRKHEYTIKSRSNDKKEVMVDDVNRLLEVGRLLFSVLTRK